MVSKCANPNCASVFRYLHEGRLFHVPGQATKGTFSGGSAHDEFFWLCSECSKQLTIVVDSSIGAHIAPRPTARAVGAAGP